MLADQIDIHKIKQKFVLYTEALVYLIQKLHSLFNTFITTNSNSIRI